MKPEQEQKLQNFVALCKRLEPCATEIKGQRALIERTINRAVSWHKTHQQTVLILVCPIAHDGDILDWTWSSPSHEHFRDVVTNRIRRGFLPIGMMDNTVSGPVLAAMADSVSVGYREDFIEFAKIEADIIYKQQRGMLSKDGAWSDDLEPKDGGKIEFKTGGGKSLSFHLMDWKVESEN